MDHTWIIVAHNGGARIFRRTLKKRGLLELLQEISNPQGELKNRDINSDRPGRTFSHGTTNRHGYSPRVDPEEQIMIRFAKKLACILDEARSANLYRYLILVAQPQMLGLLRESISKPTAERVIRSLAKNFGYMNGREIQSHIVDLFSSFDREVLTRRSA